jgi:hypothetical protein
VHEAEAEKGWKVLGHRTARDHQVDRPRVRPLHLGGAGSPDRPERDPELHLQIGLHPAAFIGLFELLDEIDRARQVLDRAIVRREPDRTEAGMVEGEDGRLHKTGDVFARRVCVLEGSDMVVGE